MAGHTNATSLILFLYLGINHSLAAQRRRTLQPTPQPTPPLPPGSPRWGPGPTATPEKYGLNTTDIKYAESFINENVKGRQCLLMAKNGEIIYESGDRNQVFQGYSMTKTIGFVLVLMAASQGKLDIDADITEKYGIPSPKTYGVSCRMMMSMVLGGETGPGQMWRYDELGDMWMGVIPQVIYKATGKNATMWLQQLHKDLQLSPSFTWPTVEKQWGFGANGTCEDWGRFAQLILNDGYWGETSLISPSLIQQAQQPVKYDPYNMYSNPCYGLGWWLNPDKEQYNGCCWEASRLVPPNCNNETFIQGATHKLTFTLGLYGQVVLAIPERNVTVVSLGRDLRPIEPIRIGVYPGICKMLDLPCNTPPVVPQPKCGETLECLGMSAQCFSGYGNWSHDEPVPAGSQCVECFMQRVRDQTSSSNQHGSRQMIQDNCPFTDRQKLSEYLECFCYEGDNVFAPWPSTTTTTPAPKAMPPVPHPYTTPAPHSPLPCDVPSSCWTGLQNAEHHGVKCVDSDPYKCGLCLYKNWGKKKSLHEAGCPGTNVSLGSNPYKNWNFMTLGFCLCGPLDQKKHDCPVKISGICNAYDKNVSITTSGKHDMCTAPAGGMCQFGDRKIQQIIHCDSSPTDCMRAKHLPEIVSSDQKLDTKFWVNLSAYAVTGMERNHGNFTNFTDFAHTCGYDNEWSIVIDESAKISFHQSQEGALCPSKLFDDSSVGLQSEDSPAYQLMMV